MGIVDKIVTWARIKSPWVLHLNSGGCNGCDIEILDALTPRWTLAVFERLALGAGSLLDLLDLALGQRAGVVEQPADERRLAVVNVTDHHE